jgi:5-methylcytosine-specific restriction endonuclease McrA
MVNVLLLNASYEPLQIISGKRAVNLLFADKADLIEAIPGRELRSPSVRQPMPSVLRLRYYVNVPQRGATWSRRGVLIRDRYTCQYCGKKMLAREATLDHIIPQWKCRKQGVSPNTWGNTVASCQRCQQRKAGRSMHEAGMRFHDPLYEPKTPRANYLVMTSDIRPEWRQYIRM